MGFLVSKLKSESCFSVLISISSIFLLSGGVLKKNPVLNLHCLPYKAKPKLHS